MFKIIKKIISELSLLALIAAIGFGCSFVFSSKVQDVKNQITGITTSYNTKGDDQVLTNQLKNICELSSLEFDYTNSYSSEKSLQLGGIKFGFTTKTIVVIYEGTMKIGIDCKKLTIDTDYTKEGKLNKVIIGLPDMEILSNEVDYSTIDFPIEDNGFLNSIDQEDRDAIQNDLTTKIEEDVIQSNVLDQARENLEKELTEFLEAVYGDTLEVEFVSLG